MRDEDLLFDPVVFKLSSHVPVEAQRCLASAEHLYLLRHIRLRWCRDGLGLWPLLLGEAIQRGKQLLDLSQPRRAYVLWNVIVGLGH